MLGAPWRMLPTVLRASGFWFYFDGAEAAAAGPEPPHVHVRRGSAEARVCIESARITQASGFATADLREIRRMTRAHRHFFREAWHDYSARLGRQTNGGFGRQLEAEVSGNPEAPMV